MLQILVLSQWQVNQSKWKNTGNKIAVKTTKLSWGNQCSWCISGRNDYPRGLVGPNQTEFFI